MLSSFVGKAVERAGPCVDASVDWRRRTKPMGSIKQVLAQRVSRHFGSTVALAVVDASFEAGVITSLEGPNGSGKSTLLGILGTTIPPTRGRILFDDRECQPSEIRQHIGWVSHETHCYPDLTPEQNLKLAASLYGSPPETWLLAAKRFGVEAFAARSFRKLSRGQRQRVALARALVHEPSILLLDEPTNGLDTDGIERLVDALNAEAARGCIIVLVTHDAGLAERVATKRLHLERGRVKSRLIDEPGASSTNS